MPGAGMPTNPCSTLERAARSCFVRDDRRNTKNPELLMRLAPVLNQIGLDLWVAGDLAASHFEADREGALSNVRFLGRIDDADLAHAFHNAVCFLFPSRIEGFGLPAIEAMTCGCPVVASTSPCIPEICGDGALYADPDDVAAWLSCVKVLTQDSATRQRQKRKGYAQAERYSWRATAERYLSLMAEVDAEADAADTEGSHI